jgi:hypothetical protein
MFAFELGYQHRYAPRANRVLGQNDNELQLTLLSTAPIRRFHRHAQEKELITSLARSGRGSVKS